MKKDTITLDPFYKSSVCHVEYRSLKEFANDCRVSPSERRHSSITDDVKSWWGGDSLSVLKNKCFTGEETHVAKAEAILQLFQDEVFVQKPTWNSSVYGAFPNVPDFLAGEVECMRTLSAEDSVSSPLRIFFDPTSSAVIQASDLVTRGTAVLALTMVMSMIRPVELWIYSNLDADPHQKGESGLSLITIQLNTQPLMLSEVCFALCNPGFARGLMYGMAEDRWFFSGGWGFDDCDDLTRDDYEQTPIGQALARALRAEKTDIIIPAVFSASQDLIRDPVQFVRHHLDRYKQLMAE